MSKIFTNNESERYVEMVFDELASNGETAET
jgi:hypothetical protein